ncbi:hypothetical protein C4D60_Mb06t05610 [Musa balbisiana]|uniref:Uncharacterized protein n=1 Tax=Musa balbisiana TaxID=52838 RepID=A0A4S8INA9_MUSBA|nr:hypothetical protein C4D60_Mb06t05610 [Musa balbisiana]
MEELDLFVDGRESYVEGSNSRYNSRTPPPKNSSLHQKHYLRMKVAQPGDAKFDPPARDVHQKSNEEDHLTNVSF